MAPVRIAARVMTLVMLCLLTTDPARHVPATRNVGLLTEALEAQEVALFAPAVKSLRHRHSRGSRYQKWTYAESALPGKVTPAATVLYRVLAVETDNIAPCGSDKIANRPVPGMSCGPTISFAPSPFAWLAVPSQSATWK